jgi:hypothetical protein
MSQKNVLIPVKDVVSVENSLQSMAEWLGKLHGDINIKLLSVTNIHDLDAATPTAEDLEVKKVFLKKFKESLSGLGFQVEYKTVMGRFVDEVLREANDISAFSILITTRGRRFLPWDGLDTLINKAPCPVVVFQPNLMKLTNTVKVIGGPALAQTMERLPEIKKPSKVTTAALGLASLIWYEILFNDLEFVNRFVLAGKFYSGIVVAIILVVTVMIYGSFISNMLKFMGLDTKTGH